MKKPWQKPKQPKAPWTRIKTAGFKSQQARLRPELSAAGGVKWRSKPKAILDAVYNAIAEMFKLANPFCRICELKGNVQPGPTEDIHHSRGKDGILYFDVRHFISACRSCHSWAGDNVEAARALGVTCQKGDWNKQIE